MQERYKILLPMPAWRSVRKTRRKGKVHVLFVSIPMVYICVYIYFQHKNKDYKEMGAALLALAFALLHLARTFMGLWQLHMFKQWAISCIKSMESLGYETNFPENDSWEAEESDSDDDEHSGSIETYERDTDENASEGDGGGQSSSIRTKSEHDGGADERSSEGADQDGSVESERDNEGNACGRRLWLQAFLQCVGSLTLFLEENDRIEKLADDIVVNETLIDNRLSDVHTVCKLRLFSREEKRNMKRATSTVGRLWLWFRYGCVNVLRGILFLFSLTFLKSSRFLNANSAPRLVPKRPESIWLNWATALVAQAGWALDKFVDTDSEPFADHSEVVNHFRAQLLLSAALHTQRMGSATANAQVRKSSHTRSAQDSSTKCLGFHDWHKYPKLCEGMFSKQEFLGRACKTGSGLPYQSRHAKAVEVKDGVRWYGYSSFESELRRAREALPPEIETRVKNFDVEQLEWFTIFVSVENWAPRSPSQEAAQNVEDYVANSPNIWRSASHSESPVEVKEAVHETDIAIQNLQKQLNFEKLSDFSFEHSNLRHTFDANLWGNRNVLEASCHIDNWKSLSSGEETSEMLQKNAEVEMKWFAERADDPRSECAGKGDMLEKIIQDSEKLERDVIAHRVLNKEENLFFDLTVTFVGCSMEMLRSSLAKWAEKNEGGDEGSWKPSLFPTVHGARESEILDPFTASADFMSCLRSLRTFRGMSKRFVKMRVLWELQNQFHTHLPREGVAPSRREAMALCILSFPSVCVDAVRMKTQEECLVDLEAGDERMLRIDDYGYIIRACLGPQNLKLCVSFKGREDNSKVKISIRICEMEAARVTHFDWEAWRNAFYGLLEVQRRWKESFHAPQLAFSFVPPTYHMSSGIEKIEGSKNAVIPENGVGADMSVWKGWVPHCTSICMFEIATEGFILQPGPTEDAWLPYPVSDRVMLKYQILQQMWVPTKYNRANPVWLKNASLVVDDLLQSKFGSNGQRDAQSALIRAEALLVRNSDADGDLALQLIQVSAVHERDISALKKAIDILLRNGKGLEAAELLEECYSFGKHVEGEPEENLGHVYSFFRNENLVKNATLLFKEILNAMKQKGLVSVMYRMFLLFSIIYGGVVPGIGELLSQSIDEYGGGDSAICFAFLLEKGRNGVQRDLPRAIDLYERGIDYNRYAMYNLAVLLSNGEEDVEQDVPRAIELFDKLIDHYEDENAMIKLADLLVQGGESRPKDLPHAVELYTRAIKKDKDCSVEAMEKLADVLRMGGDGVERDVQRAASLYTRAIEKGGSTSAMDALANILETGDGGVPADPERATALSNIVRLRNNSDVR